MSRPLVVATPRKGLAMRKCCVLNFHHRAVVASILFIGPLYAGGDLLDGIGVIGSSSTDEYQFRSGGRQWARNWVEQLAPARSFNFGAFSLESRAEPRPLQINSSLLERCLPELTLILSLITLIDASVFTA